MMAGARSTSQSRALIAGSFCATRLESMFMHASCTPGVFESMPSTMSSSAPGASESVTQLTGFSTAFSMSTTASGLYLHASTSASSSGMVATEGSSSVRSRWARSASMIALTTCAFLGPSSGRIFSRIAMSVLGPSPSGSWVICATTALSVSGSSIPIRIWAIVSMPFGRLTRSAQHEMAWYEITSIARLASFATISSGSASSGRITWSGDLAF
mmetsp:Transcript_37052/g.99930  ORF Transcript_37052/g.99930 Transcript_37052/m.99930 type:complete len:214 (+) Transcript_37052:2861-3502(+)